MPAYNDVDELGSDEIRDYARDLLRERQPQIDTQLASLQEMLGHAGCTRAHADVMFLRARLRRIRHLLSDRG